MAAMASRAHKLAGGDRVDGIACGVLVLHGQRELQAPLEHHLEHDVHVRTIGLHHIEHELTLPRLFNAGVIKRKDTKTDIG